MGKSLFVFVLPALWCLSGCETAGETDPPDPPEKEDEIIELGDFPEFITPVDKYFDVSIGGHPELSADSYELRITGAVDDTVTFTLDQLRELEMFGDTVTIECQGNPVNGGLIGTASWKGFRVIDLLQKVGLKTDAWVVRYTAADGYHTYNTIEELQDNEVMGALYMNGEPLTRKYGFPLRIVHPGFYGVRQPGWIVEMEVMTSVEADYWARLGWHTDSAMALDSKIFFPSNYHQMDLGESVRIGGAAFGKRRVASVEITIDEGETWIPADKYKRTAQEHVWIFWEVTITPKSPGTITLYSRAIAEDGTVQPREDKEHLDGRNSWPAIRIVVDNQ